MRGSQINGIDTIIIEMVKTGGTRMIEKYWSDYACPFCYIGDTSLKQAITNLKMNHDIQLEMKAFELDPEGSKHYEGPTDERYSKKLRMPSGSVGLRAEKI